MTKGAENTLTVKRNEVEVDFPPTNFARGKRAQEGIKYPSTGDITEETLGKLKKWLGDENFFGMLNEAWRLWQQQVFNAVLSNNDDVFAESLWKQYMEELSTRGESMEDLEIKLGAINDSFVKIVDEMQSNPSADIMQLKSEFVRLSEEAKKIKTAINSKKRIRVSKKVAADADAEADSN